MKGPVALVIPGTRAGADLVARASHPATHASATWRLAAVVGAVVGLPWYGAMTLEHGLPYLQGFFVGDNLERFATDRFNEPRGLWFYLPIVIGGMFPWSMYLVTLPWRSIAAIVRRQRRLTDVEWRLLAWAFLPLLFFTISIGKQPRYILPVLPPLAILLARSIAERIAED